MTSALQLRMSTLVIAFAAITTSAMFVAIPDGRGGTVSAGSRTATAAVALENTALGKVLADGRGRTLYVFVKDKNRQSVCTGSCAQFWPPLLSSGKVKRGAGVRASLLGVITRKDGRHQVTYAGHPLYTFVADSKPGQTNGEGSFNFGAPWYVLGANGRPIISP